LQAQAHQPADAHQDKKQFIIVQKKNTTINCLGKYPDVNCIDMIMTAPLIKASAQSPGPETVIHHWQQRLNK